MTSIHIFNIKMRQRFINNAIDLDEYAFSPEIRQQYRNELHIPDDTLVIGHVGRFVYQKNHAFLIEVFREVVKKHPNTILLLIGDGELRPEIEAKVQDYHLSDKVRFLGLRKDVKKLYNCMDVFVLPSWYEGLPVVSVEAQANGLLSIFSDRVTKESMLTCSASFLSLDSGSKAWASHLFYNYDGRNKDALTELQSAGFDIKERAKRLFNWYQEGKSL